MTTNKNFSRAFLAGLAAVTLATPAMAQNLTGLYIEGQAGVAAPRDTDLKVLGSSFNTQLDNGFALSGAVGYKLLPNVRIEGEVGHFKTDISEVGGVAATGDAGITTFMANGYYDFDTGTAFKPYVGAGVGVAHANIGGNSIVDDSANALAYQAGFGVGYDLTQNIALTAGYRYLDTANFDLDTTTAGVSAKTDISAHIMRAGVRYSF